MFLVDLYIFQCPDPPGAVFVVGYAKLFVTPILELSPTL